jgi:hypothetical protein
LKKAISQNSKLNISTSIHLVSGSQKGMVLQLAKKVGKCHPERSEGSAFRSRFSAGDC